MDAEAKLIEPAEEMAEEFAAYSEEFRSVGEPFVHGELEEADGDFAALLRTWRDEADGRDLPDGRVRCTRYWLVRGRRILGTARLRHRLNEALAHEGGHIGYEVRPCERGQGWATLMLKLLVERARQLGLRRALLTCNRDNAASARVIRKNGGRLGSEGISRETGKRIQRYWIEL